jgi:hypothetical protein
MSESRVRLLLRIPANLKARLAELAEREHRSLNRQIEFLLDRSVREETAGKTDETLRTKGGHGKRS